MELWIKVKSLKGSISMLLLVGILAGLAGCGSNDAAGLETDERAYRRGKSLLREGRKDEALQAFLSVIDARNDAVESHLEAGLIYLNYLKDPLAAIYHFRHYLTLNPDGEHAEFVEELIMTAEKDFAQSLPGQPFGDAVERVNLMETVKGLRQENIELKEQVLQLQKELADQEGLLLSYQENIQALQARRESGQEVAPIVIQPPSPLPEAPEPQTPETYTVQSGDTLSRISTRVYGTSGRWMDIFQANRDQLPSPNALKPGQVLRIP